MSTLAVVEEILRETQSPMSVREIVEYANGRLPTKSKTPDTVVARDLSMDIKKKGEDSIFIRTAPGRYTMREIHMRILAEQQGREAQAAAPATDGNAAARPPAEDATSVLSSAIRADRAGALASRKPAPVEQSSVPVSSR